MPEGKMGARLEHAADARALCARERFGTLATLAREAARH
jgi:hypothetical protein